MKKAFKSLISLFLIIVMVSGTLPLVVSAKDESVTAENNINITATNTLGKLMTEALGDISIHGNSYISNVAFDDGVVTVNFAVEKTAKLVVAIYDDQTKQMLDSKIVSVKTNDKEKIVSFDMSFPDVFLIKAFLLDGNNESLCNAYSKKIDSEAYKDFMSTTTDDFSKEKVIKLDNSKTNNFLVLADGVKRISSNNNLNVLESVNGNTYVFTKTNSTFRALKEGDIFYLNNGDTDDVTVIKVKSITSEGRTSTVIADEAKTDELFEFVKINDKADETSFVMEEVGENFSIDNKARSNRVASAGNMSKNQSFTLEYYENNVSVGGTVNLGIESTYLFYFSKEYSEISYVIKPSFGVDITFSGKTDIKKFEWLKIATIISGIKVELSLDFVASASASVSLSGMWSANVGARWDTLNGVSNLSSRPEFKPEVKVEGEFFVGAELELSASLIDEKIAGIAFGGSLGVVITATLSNDKDVDHSCQKCIDGDIGWKAGLDVSVTILKINDDMGVELSKPLLSASGKICDFYYSFDFEEFGFTECPHRGLELGSYPQTQVGDKKLIAELNKLEKKWISYGYYSGTGAIGSMVQSDYMKYADVSYKGNKYRAVTFSSYRPCDTKGTGEDGSYQTDNGYYTNEVYWFIFEPLKWSILDPSTGLILCDTIVDSQPYNNMLYAKITSDDYAYHTYYQRYLGSGIDYYKDPGFTTECSNYATSSIREWLNNDFYNTAFTDLQKEMINVTAVDNTVYDYYVCETTYDKVFLPSIEEIITYSWSPILFNPSAYALCQGLKSPIAAPWLLRTGGADSGSATIINFVEDEDLWSTELVFHGIRPAMTIDLNYASSRTKESNEVKQSSVREVVTVTNGSSGYEIKNCEQKNNSSVNENIHEQGTQVQKSSVESINYEFEKCIPGNKYILMNVSGYSDDDFILTEENLNYIDEVTANEDGKVIGNFIPKTNSANDTTLLFGTFEPCKITITDAPTEKVNYKTSFSLGLTWEKETGDETVTWTSSDENVLKVDESGTVTAVGKGTATITATVDGTDVNDFTTITVDYAWWQWILLIFLFGWIWY